MGKYDDIINLPHHVSSTHPHMPMRDRAAQFMPFRALTGYEAAVHETARPTDSKAELTEDEKSLLDLRLQELADRITEHPKVTLTYFQPDKRKTGGACVTITGRLKKFDEYEGELPDHLHFRVDPCQKCAAITQVFAGQCQGTAEGDGTGRELIEALQHGHGFAGQQGTGF